MLGWGEPKFDSIRNTVPISEHFAEPNPVRPAQPSSPTPNQFAQPNPERTPDGADQKITSERSIRGGFFR